MVGLFAFDSQFTSLAADRKIPLSIRHQLIYSYSLDCAGVLWGPLSLLVVSLTLVYGIHQWPVIKRFLPCSTSRTFIRMVRSVHTDFGWRPWDRVTQACYTLCPRLRWSLFWVLSHRSTLYWSVAMYHSSHRGMDPQCTCSWPYLSYLVYMDLHCIGRQPCFESNMFWAWVCPPQLWYIWSLVFFFAAPISSSGLTQIYQSH